MVAALGNVETPFLNSGSDLVVGVDEVGRGAWAGRVSVGVAVIDRACMSSPLADQVCDSKAVSSKRRQGLAKLAESWCVAFKVGSATSQECDRLGMRDALHLATTRAIEVVGSFIDISQATFLVDGNLDFVNGRYSSATRKVVTIIKGDQVSKAIGAASLVAKVERDQEMVELSESYPGFDFNVNKGYPSPTHKRALVGYGPTSIHRLSWASMNLVPWQVG